MQTYMQVNYVLKDYHEENHIFQNITFYGKKLIVTTIIYVSLIDTIITLFKKLKKGNKKIKLEKHL